MTHPDHDIAVSYLESLDDETGLTTVRRTFEADGMSLVNLEIRIEGTDSSLPPAIFMGHYDSTAVYEDGWDRPTDPAPGAVDNAASIAVLLEIAQAFHEQSEESPLPIDDATLKIFATSNPPEAVCLLGREGGILIAGDSLQHTPTPDEFFNFVARIVMKRMGFLKPYNVGPGWLQFAKPSVADVRSILDLEFQHVLPCHGDAVIGGAKEKYRPAIEGART